MKDTLQFILAGNALFTVENAETGNRFTFKALKFFGMLSLISLVFLFADGASVFTAKAELVTVDHIVCERPR